MVTESMPGTRPTMDLRRPLRWTGEPRRRPTILPTPTGPRTQAPPRVKPPTRSPGSSTNKSRLPPIRSLRSKKCESYQKNETSQWKKNNGIEQLFISTSCLREDSTMEKKFELSRRRAIRKLMLLQLIQFGGLVGLNQPRGSRPRSQSETNTII